jgi:hypothetical protein
MVAEAGADVHHRVPRCLLGLFDTVAGASPAGRSSTQKLSVGASRSAALPRRPEGADQELYPPDPYHGASQMEHRTLHQEASNFVWWGRREDLRTLALYGRPYFSLLARLRWGVLSSRPLPGTVPGV